MKPPPQVSVPKEDTPAKSQISKKSHANLGATLITIGALSFVLPLIGFQFSILAFFGEAAPLVAIIMIVIGLILLKF